MTRDLTGATRAILGLCIGASVAIAAGHTITKAQTEYAAVRVQMEE